MHLQELKYNSMPMCENKIYIDKNFYPYNDELKNNLFFYDCVELSKDINLKCYDFIANK